MTLKTVNWPRVSEVVITGNKNAEIKMLVFSNNVRVHKLNRILRKSLIIFFCVFYENSKVDIIQNDIPATFIYFSERSNFIPPPSPNAKLYSVRLRETNYSV